MSGKYDALGLYHDPADPRLIIPKANPMMGWTINAAHPLGRAALVVVAVVVVAVASLTLPTK